MRHKICHKKVSINLAHFLKKLCEFTNDHFIFRIIWKTRNVRSFFPLKDRNRYQSCKIYKGVCSCGATYIGETERNVSVRWNEHNHPDGKSEPSKHLRENIDHEFTWSVISDAPKNMRTRRNLEASFFGLYKPSLNEQLESNTLNLFRNGVT